MCREVAPAKMAMCNSAGQIGDDGDSLTDMDEASRAELSSRDDSRRQRDVS
jgi:hypothetical protein